MWLEALKSRDGCVSVKIVSSILSIVYIIGILDNQQAVSELPRETTDLEYATVAVNKGMTPMSIIPTIEKPCSLNDFVKKVSSTWLANLPSNLQQDIKKSPFRFRFNPQIVGKRFEQVSDKTPFVMSYTETGEPVRSFTKTGGRAVAYPLIVGQQDFKGLFDLTISYSPSTDNAVYFDRSKTKKPSRLLRLNKNDSLRVLELISDRAPYGRSFLDDNVRFIVNIDKQRSIIIDEFGQARCSDGVSYQLSARGFMLLDKLVASKLGG